MIRERDYDSPLGRIRICSDGEKLTGLRFEDGELEKPGKPLSGRLRVFSDAEQWLDLYFQGEIPDRIPELGIRTTPFQKEVLEEVLRIPYGMTVTYGEIAERVSERTGRRVGPRAVGRAVGSNPIALIIPCHRVIGADGGLRGYAWGLERKMWLLQMEKKAWTQREADTGKQLSE